MLADRDFLGGAFLAEHQLLRSLQVLYILGVFTDQYKTPAYSIPDSLKFSQMGHVARGHLSACGDRPQLTIKT